MYYYLLTCRLLFCSRCGVDVDGAVAHGNGCHGNAGGMAVASWLLSLCLIHDRPANHLPIDANDNLERLDKKVTE